MPGASKQGGNNTETGDVHNGHALRTGEVKIEPRPRAVGPEPTAQGPVLLLLARRKYTRQLQLQKKGGQYIFTVHFSFGLLASFENMKRLLHGRRMRPSHATSLRILEGCLHTKNKVQRRNFQDKAHTKRQEQITLP